MSTLPETVLSNPIISLSVRDFCRAYNNGSGVRSSIKSWVQSLQKLRGVPEEIEPHRSVYNPDLWRMYNDESSDLSGLSIAMSCLELMSGFIRKGLGEILTKELMSRLAQSWPEVSIFSDKSALWYKRQEFWYNIVQCQHRIARSNPKQWEAQSFGWVCKRYALIWRGSMLPPLLMDSDMILMIKDICSSYFISQIYKELTSGLTLPEDGLEWFEEWTGEVLTSYGNRGYNMIKSLESMCKARIIQLSEPVLDPDEVWTEMTLKLREKERGCVKIYSKSKVAPADWDIPESSSTELTDSLVKYLQSLTQPEELSELFCLMKMAGHPHVKVRLGGLKSKKLGTKRATLPIGVGMELERSFCHIYTRGFIKRHREWPPLKFLRNQDEPRCMLEVLRDRNFQNLPLGLSMYPSEDWDQCAFIPHKIFNKGEDILALLSDKALSFRRDEFDCAWQYDLNYKPRKPTTSRRVLIDMLRRREFNLETVCEWVSSRSVPAHHKIVTLCPKEREMKLEPRMFSMMTLEMRTFFALLEKNIADNIFCEIPEQTMTESRLETVNRFYGISGNSKGDIRAHLELDLESWNLLWEDSTVSPVGNRIDQIHGTVGLFTYIHQFFDEAMINVRVDGFIPDGLVEGNRHHPPDSPLLWYRHHSGFEGIAQKMWTATTAAMIHTILWPMGLDYSISGQGDNQVISLTVRYPQKLDKQDKVSFVRQLVHIVKSRLSSGCRRYGQIAKPEECLQSTTYFTYSKEMWLDGRSLPTTLKGISRLFPTTTSESPSLQEMIGGLTSGALASTERSLRPAEGYWPALIATCILLHKEMNCSLLHSSKLGDQVNYRELRHNDKVARIFVLSSIPQSLGGFPVPLWSEFCYRGVPDPLSSGIAWIKLLRHSIPHLKWVQMIRKDAIMDSSPNAKRLVLDPFSIPLSKPLDPTTAVSNAVKDKLIDISLNKEIFEMLSLRRQSEDQLLTDITIMTPLYPKIAHDLYCLSVPGVVAKFSRRFTNTRTIMSVGRLEGIQIPQISISSDLATSLWIIQNIGALNSYPPVDPTTLHSYLTSRELRLKWGIGELEGVSIVHPIDIGIYDCQCRPGLEHRDNLIVSVMDNIDQDPLVTRGTVVPYLGSSTQIKAAYKGAKLVESSPPIRDCLKLLQTRKAISIQGSAMWNLITSIAQSRAQFDIDVLEPYVPPIIGGTLAHRFNLTDAESGSYLSCHPNIASHIALSSNLSKGIGEEDRPVVYQTIYLFLMFLHTLCWTRPHKSTFIPKQGPRSIYVLVDLDKIPPLFDIRPELTRQPSYCLVKTPSNFYLTGNQAYIHSRSKLSAFMHRPDGIGALPISTQAPVEQALRYVARQRIKATPTPLLQGGVSWALTSGARLVDLPEASHISKQDYERAFGQASLDFLRIPRTKYHGRWESRTSWIDRVKDEVVNTFLPISPSFLSTYNEGFEDRPHISRELLIGIEGGVRLTSRVLQIVETCIKEPAITIFVNEPESLLSGGLIILNRLVTTACQSDNDQNYRTAQLIAKISRVIRLRSNDDYDWQARLWQALPDVLELLPIASQSSDHPTSILRSLRLSKIVGSTPDISHLMFERLFEVSSPCLECKVGGLPITFPETLEPLGEEELTDNWTIRRGLVGSAEVLWSPLSELINVTGRIHVVGAGRGYIDRVVPATVAVTYYDTASYSVVRGQKLVDPPSALTSLAQATRWMSSLSWTCTYGLDITDRLCLHELSATICPRDTVVVDVDGVDMAGRIEATNTLIRSNPEALILVKLFGPEHLITKVIINCCASGDRNRIWWRSPFIPSREIVVGSVGLCLTMYEPHSMIPCPNDLVYLPVEDYLPTLRSDEELEYIKLSNILSRKRCKLARRDPNRQEQRLLTLETILTSE